MSLPAVSRSAYCSSLMTERPEPRAAARPADAHAPFVELVAAAVQHVAVVAHEESDLVGRALPVLGRERVDGEVLHADLDGARDDVEQRRLPRLVSLDAREAAAVRPPAVAVHDDRDVLGHGAPGQRRAGGCRSSRRGDRAPHPCACRAWGSLGAVSRETWGRERSPRSRCHWAYAATIPLAWARSRSGGSLRVRPVAREQRSEQRDRRPDRCAGVPGGAHASHTTPPSCTTTAVCGPARRNVRSPGSSAPSRRATVRAAGRSRG